MRGKLKDLTFNRDGTQVVSLTVSGDFRQEFDKLNGQDVEITITKAAKRRSLDANAYCWVLIDRISEALHIGKKEVYRQAILDIGGVSTTVCVPDHEVGTLRDVWQKNGVGWQTETMPSKIKGCTVVTLYYGSSVYDTRQMSALIDHLVQDAEAIGIETLTPQRKAELLKQWTASCKRTNTAT